MGDAEADRHARIRGDAPLPRRFAEGVGSVRPRTGDRGETRGRGEGETGRGGDKGMAIFRQMALKQ